MMVDYEKVREVIETAGHGYYEREKCRVEREVVFAPQIDEVFGRACGGRGRVLDIGCGNGRTLIRNSGCFEEGVGVDNDPEHVRLAEENLRSSGVKNVRFVEGRADNLRLRFEPESFDLVFTERGPLPGSDVNTMNAVSVLRRGGVLMAENPGPLMHFEVGLIFDKPVKALHPVPPHGQLDGAAEELARNGIEVQFTCSIAEKLVFPDLYEWMRYHISAWDYYGDCRFEWPLPERVRHGLERFLSVVMDEEGRVRVSNQRMWVMGVKR